VALITYDVAMRYLFQAGSIALQALESLGVHTAFHISAEAGLGSADHACAKL